MFQFVMRRLLGGVLVLWVVVTTTFFALHFAPGDPAEAALSQSTASEDVLRQRREALGLDLPLGVQYCRFLIRLAPVSYTHLTLPTIYSV